MNSQRGGFALGLIVGLLAGLVIALGLALYVTKVPVPFLNKVPQRSAEQDAAEAERNKHWDPNAPLAPRGGARPVPVPPAASAAVPAGTAANPLPSAAAPVAAKPAPHEGESTASTKSGPDPFVYFVQVGAYTQAEDAEQQRARVGLLGLSAKVSEREQAGRTIYRVRLGPFERRDDANAAQQSLASGGVEAALVRVAR